jgi:hypothetical protein
MKTSTDEDQGWGIAAARLPDSLAGWKVLELGGTGRGRDALIQRGAATVHSCERLEELADRRRFDLVHYPATAKTASHPLAVLASLWHAIAPAGTLLLGSRALDDPALSQYAHCEPPTVDADDRQQWIPGRLALRWMVEVSGFEVQHWLGERRLGSHHPVTVTTYLQAVRTDREPAL